MLRLNFAGRSGTDFWEAIQIQPMLRLNELYKEANKQFPRHSNTTNVKVKQGDKIPLALQ